MSHLRWRSWSASNTDILKHMRWGSAKTERRGALEVTTSRTIDRILTTDSLRSVLRKTWRKKHQCFFKGMFWVHGRLNSLYGVRLISTENSSYLLVFIKENHVYSKAYAGNPSDFKTFKNNLMSVCTSFTRWLICISFYTFICNKTRKKAVNVQFIIRIQTS